MLKTALPPDWVVYESEETLQLCLMKSNPPTLTRSVTLNPDFTWFVHVHKRVVPGDNEVIKWLPERVTSVSTLTEILIAVKLKLLANALEIHFVQILEKRGGSVVGINGSVSAIIDSQEDVVSGGMTYNKTVRHSECEVSCLLPTLDNALVVRNIDRSYMSCTAVSRSI